MFFQNLRVGVLDFFSANVQMNAGRRLKMVISKTQCDPMQVVHKCTTTSTFSQRG